MKFGQDVFVDDLDMDAIVIRRTNPLPTGGRDGHANRQSLAGTHVGDVGDEHQLAKANRKRREQQMSCDSDHAQACLAVEVRQVTRHHPFHARHNDAAFEEVLNCPTLYTDQTFQSKTARVVSMIQADFIVDGRITKREGNVTRRQLCRTSAVATAFILGVSLQALPMGQGGDTAPGGAITIGGDVARALTLTIPELKTMPRTTVTISEQGRDVKYTGVLVGEILARAGAPLGRDLSGPAVATYVLASGNDGYQALFSLAELDPAFTSNDIIIADTVDDQPLFDYQGPLRIVAPHDKRGARGVRMLQRLEVVRLRK